MLGRDFFPWIHDPYARISLFDQDRVRANEGFERMSEIYKSTVGGVSFLETDSPETKRSRIATVLSTDFFMQHLLCRKDRMSMAASVEVRVPFADHRIIEYVYNVPWEIKFENRVEKALLRNAAASISLLPDEILKRRKSPYPKTHDPRYESIVCGMLEKELAKDSLFTSLIDREKVGALLDPRTENITWYGQLMSRPQLIAWLLQLSYWFEKYGVQPTFP